MIYNLRTKNCIVCGKPANIFTGHVLMNDCINKDKNYHVIAGFCSDEHINQAISDNYGCFGKFNYLNGIDLDIG